MVDCCTDTTTITKDGMDIVVLTVEEAAWALTMGDVPEGVEIVAEIPKSPCTPGPKKEK